MRTPSNVRAKSLKMVVDAVYFQPVLALNSLLAGKIQGISSNFAPIAIVMDGVVPRNQALPGKFPVQVNRESSRRNRQVSGAKQGDHSIRLFPICIGPNRDAPLAFEP